MTSNAHKLKPQAQGRITVPTDIRADLGVQEGDELILVSEEYGYHLTSRKLLAKSMYGSLRKPEGDERDFTQELLDGRKAEAQGKGW